MFRQGDVLLVPSQIPNNAKVVTKGNPVLAYGEATGHHHVLRNQTALLLEANGKTYVNLQETSQLTHEEHTPIEIPKGTYEVVRQVEYTPQALRNVND